MMVLADHLETSFSSRLEVRFDVPWIQVSDAHQKPWSCEGPKLTETEHLRGRTAVFLLSSIQCSTSQHHQYQKMHNFHENV